MISIRPATTGDGEGGGSGGGGMHRVTPHVSQSPTAHASKQSRGHPARFAQLCIDLDGDGSALPAQQWLPRVPASYSAHHVHRPSLSLPGSQPVSERSPGHAIVHTSPPEKGGGSDGCGEGGNGDGNGGNGGGEGARLPQSVQSDPKTGQMEKSEPGPPSSQSPSLSQAQAVASSLHSTRTPGDCGTGGGGAVTSRGPQSAQSEPNGQRL